MARSTKSSGTTPKATPAGRARKKRTSPAKPAAAVDPAATTASPVVSLVTGAADSATRRASDTADAAFRRPDLIDAVASRTSLKRPQAKEVMELVLEELGAALDRHETVVLPPLGKIAIKDRKETGSATMLTAKIRRPAPEKPAATGLADPDAEG